jgi:hypothetical protein
MRKFVYVPEKTIASQEVGDYEVRLRSRCYYEKHGETTEPLYELTIWNRWTLVSTTTWNGWENVRREFDVAKRALAVKLAEDVLFN